MLTNIWHQIISNPILLIIAIVVVVFLGISLLKKLFKIAIYAVILVLLFLGYVWLTSDQPEKDVKKMIKQGTETIVKTKEQAKKVSSELDENLKKVKELKKKVDQ